MAGISSKAAGSLENKKSKYNGYELNTDFDLNLYESFYRTHDPQIGRFWQLDPKPYYEESLFIAMGNNPIKNSDLLGDKYKLKGSDGDKKDYIEYLNLTTGNKYKLNKNGEVVRVNKKFNTKTTGQVSATLSSLVDEAIKNEETITMNLKNDDASDKRIKADIAATGEVDMKDLAKVNQSSKQTGDNALLAGVLGHFIKELMLLPGEKQQDTEARKDAHKEAEKVDGKIVSEMLGIPNGPRVQGKIIFGSKNEDGNIVNYYNLQYGNGAVNYYIPYNSGTSRSNGTVTGFSTGEILGRILKVETKK